MSGKLAYEVTRRAFIQKLGAVLALAVLPFQHWLGRGSSSRSVIYQMRPLAGLRYSRAARNHMKNRMFPSREAIRAELPHRGLIFAVAEIPVELSHEELERAFDGRASLDRRRANDGDSYQKIAKASKVTLVNSA